MNRSDVLVWRMPGPSREMNGRRARAELRGSMKLAFFSIPILNPPPEHQVLNAFLAQHRMVNVDRHLVTEYGHAVWAIYVTYLDAPAALETTPNTSRQPARKSANRERVEYREVLSPDEFRVFAQLRDIRKTASQRAGIPLYSAFTNEELATMVRGRMQTKTDVQKIDGVGQARIDEYAEPFIEVLHEAWSEQSTSSKV